MSLHFLKPGPRQKRPGGRGSQRFIDLHEASKRRRRTHTWLRSNQPPSWVLTPSYVPPPPPSSYHVLRLVPRSPSLKILFTWLLSISFEWHLLSRCHLSEYFFSSSPIAFSLKFNFPQGMSHFSFYLVILTFSTKILKKVSQSHIKYFEEKDLAEI